MNYTEPKIVRIVDVRDTRDRVEVGDKWIPIPGTGQMRPCDRCSKTHEIHVDVELDNGKRANIGSGCAKGESMDVQSRIKSAVSGVKTRSKLAAQLAAAVEEHKRATEAWDRVQAMKPPPVVLIEERPDGRGGILKVLGMGDARVWVHSWSDETERRQSLLGGWRDDQYKKNGPKYSPFMYKQQVADLRDRLAKQDKKLKSLMF